VSKSKRDLTGEEKKLWRRVASSVKTRRPLPADIDEPEPPKPAARDVVAAAAPPPPPPKKPRVAPAPPHNRIGEKRVRRGKLDLGGSLDLHGHDQESAPAAIARFLWAAQKRGETTVIIITGVGRGGEGILKRRLPDWLSSPDLRTIVGGYAPAHRTHGGTGAFYVFVKRLRESEY